MMKKEWENRWFAYHKYTSGSWHFWIGECCQIIRNNKDYPFVWGYRNLWKERGVKESNSFQHLLELGRIHIYW